MGKKDGSRCTRYGYVEGRRSGPGSANGMRREDRVDGLKRCPQRRSSGKGVNRSEVVHSLVHSRGTNASPSSSW